MNSQLFKTLLEQVCRQGVASGHAARSGRMPPSAATAACGGTTVGRAKRSLASQAPAGGGCGRSRKGGPRRRQASDREGGVGQASARFGINSSSACTLGICATPPSATRLLRRHVGLEDGAVRGLLHVGSLGVCVMPGGTHPRVRVADTHRGRLESPCLVGHVSRRRRRCVELGRTAHWRAPAAACLRTP